MSLTRNFLTASPLALATAGAVSAQSSALESAGAPAFGKGKTNQHAEWMDADNLSWTMIRVAAGLFHIPHGAQKLFGWFGGGGLSGTGQFFEDFIGLTPGILFAGAVGLAEFLGGIFLALGLLTRLSAASALAIMVVATFAVHWDSGFFWTNGGFEYPALWGLVALAFVIRGAGPLSVDHGIGWKY